MVVRLIVALAIIMPLLLIVGFGRPWYVTFGIAALGFGTGHLVEHLVESSKKKQRR